MVFLILWVIAQFGERPIPNFIAEPANSLLFFGGAILLTGLQIYPSLHKRIRRQIHRTRNLYDRQGIRDLNALSPEQFEEMVAGVYRMLGYNVKHVGRSGDHGVDLEVYPQLGVKWIVQCKRWRDSVGEPTIRELYGTLYHEGAERAILVTSAEITPQAEEWARGKPITLVDGTALLSLISTARRSSQGGWRQSFRRLQAWLQPGASTPPVCPHCKVPMVPHPRSTGILSGRKRYRCANYPECRVVIERK